MKLVIYSIGLSVSSMFVTETETVVTDGVWLVCIRGVQPLNRFRLKLVTVYSTDSDYSSVLGSDVM
jgi:hypothetical protein